MYDNINLSSFFRKPENQTIYQNILEKTNFLEDKKTTIRQRIWHITNQISNKPKCVCGNLVKWSEKLRSYRTYCSQKCKANDTRWKEKVINTNIKKYGVKTTLLEPNTKNKIKNTLLSNYGVTNPFSSKLIQEKIKEKNLNNYGVKNPAKSQIIKDKITESHIRKFGYERSSQSHLSEETLKLLNDKELLEKKYLESFSGNSLAEELNISPWLLFKQIHKLRIDLKPLKKSKEEQVILDILKSLGITNIITSDKSILHPQEIDIFLPDYNLGFEINGIYWHSESKGKTKYYHYNKSKKAKEKNINLIHFLDVDVNYNINKVTNKIKTTLGLNEKIYARKCEIKTVNKEEEKKFLNLYHFQNYIPSTLALGLFYGNELVSIMTFGKSRYNKNYEWELLRYCCKNTLTITGGASKLFKTFIKIMNPDNCISYCDLSRSFDNSFYSIIGFTKINISTPNYFYTKDYINLESRIKYQKHKLHKILINYNPKLTEWQNMSNNGWDRYWDCGNSIWAWNH